MGNHEVKVVGRYATKLFHLISPPPYKNILLKGNKSPSLGEEKTTFRFSQQRYEEEEEEWQWLWLSWSLPNPGVRSSNLVIGKILYKTFAVNCIEKTK